MRKTISVEVLLKAFVITWDEMSFEKKLTCSHFSNRSIVCVSVNLYEGSREKSPRLQTVMF